MNLRLDSQAETKNNGKMNQNGKWLNHPEYQKKKKKLCLAILIAAVKLRLDSHVSI